MERIRGLQERTLKNLLSLGKMARLIENETLNGAQAFKLTDMTTALRNSIWTEIKNGKKIDTYRRNLQREHIDRLAYLLKAENQSKRRGSDYIKSTAVNTSQSDIRAIARFELNALKDIAKRGRTQSSDNMTSIHLKDIEERIKIILNPK